ncbi:MAG: hypothetical protein QOE53_2267, partial [Pseudonocardiales bacterium]|nr:hypothetical protein [Pseudonocardiales bacterium]
MCPDPTIGRYSPALRLDLIDDRALAKKFIAALGNDRVGAGPIADRDKIVKLTSGPA